MRLTVVPAGPFHTVSASTPQPACSRYVKINLLVGQPVYFLVEPKWKAKELQSQVCSHLKNQGMLDNDLFGLATLLEGEYVFVDPEYKLSKYAPKSWRSSSTNGLDSTGKPLLEFFFRVQFYVENPLLLRDELSVEHYFAQMQMNVDERSAFHPNASHQSLYLLAGLSLQAEHGDVYQPQFYSKPLAYLPQQAVQLVGEERARELLTTLHRAHSGLSPTQARSHFLREASAPDTGSPLSYNCHIFRLRTNKNQPLPGTVIFAISTKGIQLFQDGTLKPLCGAFPWNDIGKLCFDRKKFEIRGVNWPSGGKLSFYTSSDEKSKHLLSLCKDTHQHSMAIQPRLLQVAGPQLTERKKSGDWCLDLAKYRYTGTGEQRISVISSTSSTTTSGIVSDRVHSLDESEGSQTDSNLTNDLEMEIMINSPPAASVESLALAHLNDNPESASRQPLAPLPHDDACKSSPAAMTPATTDGSQCSSSASTVVVHQPTNDPVNLIDGCESVTSSLELGYSHTAELSAVSESCCELDCSVRSAQASSGVFTLDTTTDNGDAQTAIDTVASSSGIGLESQGQRSRSGSLVSQSGSFHGDGSDPSEAGQGNPLSAEELSNLIVNPGSPRPRRGVYPGRATVSATLDSCSDYVTLPPPPQPPPAPILMFQQMAPSYPFVPDEANARFISTKPHISVLTAHSTRVPTAPAFSTAAVSRFKFNHMIPLVSPNNYLDFRASYLRAPPPPPPPPRPNVATVYTSQVTRSQIEQFKQQLYSDVDYVIYPMKDPSISKQEYLDSKLLAYRYTPPPPYPSKNIIYRSTPNVAIASSYMPYNKFSSNQNLSDYYLSHSPMYSAAASYSSSSTQSLRYETLAAPPLAPAPAFQRTVSDDNILNHERPFRQTLYRRPPPPAPPSDIPQDPIDVILEGVASTSNKLPSIGVKQSPVKVVDEMRAAEEPSPPLDISSLRERSRNLDLPLISALCNDKNLIKQTKAFVLPHHPVHSKANSLDRKSLLSSILSKSPSSGSSSKLKYPVSGLSTNQIVKSPRKPASRHKHPDSVIKISRSQSANSSYKDSKS